MDPVHPKLQIESTANISSLKTSLKKNALTFLNKYDTEIEKSGNVSETKKELETRIEKWIDIIFTLAAPGIQVNGVDYSEAEKGETFEQLDEKLRQDVDEIHEALQSQYVKLAQYRREIPHMLEQNFASFDEFKNDFLENEDPIPSARIPPIQLDDTEFNLTVNEVLSLDTHLSHKTARATTAENILQSLHSSSNKMSDCGSRLQILKRGSSNVLSKLRKGMINKR